MAQHDYSIANQGFPATRTDINNALSAISTTNSGTSAPSSQFAGQFWLDTNTPSGTTWTLYFHDGSDDITFATIDTSANTVNFSDSAPITALNNPTANELVTVGSTTTELDAETNLTFDGTTLAVTGTVEPSGDTSSGDNAAIGYTAAEGLILTGQGSTSDVTIKNDADGTVISIPTGTTNVGIGTTAPLGKLHIEYADSGGSVSADADDLVLEEGTSGQGAGMTILNATNGEARIHFGDSDDNDVGKIAYNHGSNYMQFTANTAEAMRIDSSANLLVGTTTTTINASNFGIKIASNGIIRTSANYDGGSTVTEHFGNAGQLRFMGDGDAENTNNSYGAISDERLKENITDANSQWNDIKELQIKNYNLIAYPDRTHIGVIAQDLETAEMNGLVKESKPQQDHAKIHSDFGTVISGTADNGAEAIKDEDDNITGYEDIFTEGQRVKGVKYSVLYMKAIKALQEAQTRIETLETKVTALENA